MNHGEAIYAAKLPRAIALIKVVAEKFREKIYFVCWISLILKFDYCIIIR